MAKTELHNTWIALRATGLSYRKIARRIGISTRTQVKWAKKFKDEVQQKDLNFINEQLRMEKKHRLERLSGLLEKLEDELEKRNIADTPSVSLMRIYESLVKAIRDEVEKNSSEKTQIDDSLMRYYEIISQIAEIEE